ncbi:MAG: thiol-disulfide isomerase/thioredoxin [Phycisphaerales bacterium]|jgi:thiol-disulfide isomerase/thioredoxin
MRKSVQMLITAGVMGLPMIATAGPEHAEHADKGDCPDGCAKACCVDLAQLVGFEFKAPDLFIGDKAPKLEIAQFVKGESVDGFEEGKVYVVEFWATWCGPCVAAFPHISELQKEYGDKVQVIGVNIWDRKQDRETGEFTESQGDWVQRISEFVDDQGDRMGYTVALEQDSKMAENWMKAAGRNGIPAAFIVDGNGKVAWSGHPMGIDESLEAAVKGEIDYDAAIAEAKAEQLQEKAFNAFMTGMRSDDEAAATKGYQIGRAIVAQSDEVNAQMLNSLSWTVINPDAPIPHRDYQFALDMAHQAAGLSEFKDPMILDTYALALFKNGDVKEAIKQQKKAIKLVGESESFEQYLPEFEDRLAEFESEG